jgi:hypothetical protein
VVCVAARSKHTSAFVHTGAVLVLLCNLYDFDRLSYCVNSARISVGNVLNLYVCVCFCMYVHACRQEHTA